MTGDANLAQSFAAEPFDYIVIGGGTAGLAIAARLSERQDLNIGVLEAGHRIPDNLPAVSVPGRFGEGIGTDIDWQFETVAQKALHGRKLAWPRGKCLGGTSALNFMTWNRPSRNDLDSWEQLGCQGWSWDRLLPYFKRSENFVRPTAESAEQNTIHYDADAHGTGGPVTVSFNKEYSATHKFWHKTLEALDIPINKSHTSGSNVGSFTAMVAVNPQKATREFAAPAYLRPAEKRSNLTVLTGAHVQHVIIEDMNGNWVAKGVQFEHGGSVYSASVSREVILSAGSVQSPQILERSGIGNPSILQDAGIQVKVPNSNVGENLQDHLMHATIYEVDSSVQSPDDLRTDVKLAAQADEEYKTSASGLRTWLGCSFAYIPLHMFLPPSEFSPLRSRLSDVPTPHSQARASHLEQDSQNGHIEFIFDVVNWNANYVGAPGKKYATLLQILQYPFSRGSVHVDPAAPLGKPTIDPKYYESEGSIDLEVAFHASKLGHQIVSTKPLNSLVGKRVFPSEDVGDEELKAWLVSNLTTDWHPVGTCAMGEREGVVDERLRVHGVSGLRVVDASIMPLQISAHLQATVYAIGEKGAAMILEDM